MDVYPTARAGPALAAGCGRIFGACKDAIPYSFPFHIIPLSVPPLVLVLVLRQS